MRLVTIKAEHLPLYTRDGDLAARVGVAPKASPGEGTIDVSFGGTVVTVAPSHLREVDPTRDDIRLHDD